MFVLWLLVRTLWNQLLLQLLLDLFKTLHIFFTDMMCMFEFGAEKNLFDKVAGFLT